jgi:hypothetical protein
MRHYPTDEDDMKDVARLEAPTWMVDQLRLNPSYVSWGPHEDYMWKKEGSGWDSAVTIDSWADNSFELDDLNEVVNFYFQIDRPSKDCTTCNGKGMHPDAQWISESWYHHSSPFTVPDEGEREAKAVLEGFGSRFTDPVVGRGQLPPDDVLAKYGPAFHEHCVSTMENGGEWCTNLTQDEVDALLEHGRLFDFKGRHPTAAEINAIAKKSHMLHDAINSWICIRTRCERLGVPMECPDCVGNDGQIFTGPAHLTLVLWVLHPRKGCSRGVEVKHIKQSELPLIYAYLRGAAKRNAGRFAKIPKVAVEKETVGADENSLRSRTRKTRSR